jgi:VWFA-related protein
MLLLAVSVVMLGQAAPAAAASETRALTVTLVDAKGQVVSDVSASDVALSENGVNREIASFAPDERPLSVALLVDTSAAVSSAYRLNVVDAVIGLLARLPEGSRYALWTTGDRPTKLLDYTDDRGAAAARLRMVAPQGGNYMLDALVEATEDEKFAREGDRTVVVAVSGSGPEFSYRDKQQVADAAERRAELFVSLQVDGGGADLDGQNRLSYALDRLASASGGLNEHVLSWMGVDAALKKVSAYVRSGYRLSYLTPSDVKRRKLELRVARPDTKVRIPELQPRDWGRKG